MWKSLLLCSLAVYVKSLTRNGGDLSLWIDEHQVKMFSGFSMEIYAIVDGHVLPYILDPNFEKYLPIIPSEVGYVNFTWKSGLKKYYYNFDRLQSFDENVLEPPVISIKTRGRVPRRPKVFSVLLPCSGNGSGIASFGIGLLIESRKGRPLPGTPLRLRLRKECAQRELWWCKQVVVLRLKNTDGPIHCEDQGEDQQKMKTACVHDCAATIFGFKPPQGPDPECDKKCANGGWCNHEKICQCPEGYMGQHCKTALCYPQCMNGGVCTAPGLCSCPPGFQGRHCEGGICAEKCQNGGKCVQKDTCECSKGYYGLRCEYSKCIVPCLNGGRCRGINKCRCPPTFRGDHCEIGRRVPPRSTCRRPCRHGTCRPDNTCLCHAGWAGRLCNQKVPVSVNYDDEEEEDDEEEDDDDEEEDEELDRRRTPGRRIDV